MLCFAWVAKADKQRMTEFALGVLVYAQDRTSYTAADAKAPSTRIKLRHLNSLLLSSILSQEHRSRRL